MSNKKEKLNKVVAKKAVEPIVENKEVILENKELRNSLLTPELELTDLEDKSENKSVDDSLDVISGEPQEFEESIEIEVKNELTEEVFIALRDEGDLIQVSDVAKPEPETVSSEWYIKKTQEVNIESGTFMVYRGQKMDDLGLAYTLRQRGVEMVNSISEV